MVWSVGLVLHLHLHLARLGHDDVDGALRHGDRRLDAIAVGRHQLALVGLAGRNRRGYSRWSPLGQRHLEIALAVDRHVQRVAGVGRERPPR